MCYWCKYLPDVRVSKIYGLAHGVYATLHGYINTVILSHMVTGVQDGESLKDSGSWKER